MYARKQIFIATQFLKYRTLKAMSNSKNAVYVTRPDIADIAYDVLRKECDVTVWTEKCPVPRNEFLKAIKGKNAIFCMLSEKIDAEVFDAAGPQLTCVSTMSVGYDHIDLDECRKRNVRVGYTPDILTDATAELTLALLLATSRRLLEANKQVYNDGWKAWSPKWLCGQGLKGSRVGMFGFGRIGQEIAARIVPFKPCQITYTTRTERPEAAKRVGATYVTFDEMLRESDFIIVCCALTPDTKEIFNKCAFEKMKKNCIFINTSRGAVVDQPELYKALKNKCILAAGLDVTTPEPLPLDDPLLTLDNIVILPHIGSAEVNTRTEMARITAMNILAGLKGDKMIYEIPLH